MSADKSRWEICIKMCRGKLHVCEVCTFVVLLVVYKKTGLALRQSVTNLNNKPSLYSVRVKPYRWYLVSDKVRSVNTQSHSFAELHHI